MYTKHNSVAKTMSEKIMQPIKDTIDDDEIKEEIDVVDDDSDEDEPNLSLRQRFMDRISRQRTMGRQSKTSSKLK